VSVEAISWALNLAPVPADRGGRPSSACKFVLVGLTNHAGKDGTGALPSVATLIRYTGLSERTVRTCLDRLESEGIISSCDPDIVAARIKRAGRRPQGWDLDLSLTRGDLGEPGAAVPGSPSPAPRPGLASTRRAHLQSRPNGVQPPHPARPADHQVQRLHPAAGTRRNHSTDGVQPPRPRGATVAPEPFREPSLEPSAAPLPARARPSAGGRGGGPADEFFASLPDAWMLTCEQRARLTPAAAAALGSGWTPAALAAFTGANTQGVRNPFAVLTARLSPAELPPPPRRRPARPPWCGECDQATRMLGFDADAPRPCPRCKPAATASQASPATPLARARTGPTAAPLHGGHPV
jgi:hypothetical protein